MEPFEIGTARARPGGRAAGDLVAAQPVGMPPVSIPIILVRGRAEGPALCVCGGIHGDEYARIEAVNRLAHELNPSTLAGMLVAVPTMHQASFDAVRYEFKKRETHATTTHT